MAERALVIYDGQCGFCVSSVETLRRLDVLGRLEYGDARDPELLARFPEIDPEAALRRLHLVTPGRGSILDGFYAFRWLAGRLPGLMLLWPLLWLPGASFVGVRAYDLVARNRFAFGSCESGDCEVPTPGAAAGVADSEPGLPGRGAGEKRH